jgi:hypothetical protein
MPESFAGHVIDKIDNAVLQPTGIETMQDMHDKRTPSHAANLPKDCRMPVFAALTITSRSPETARTTQGDWRAL